MEMATVTVVMVMAMVEMVVATVAVVMEEVEENENLREFQEDANAKLAIPAAAGVISKVLPAAATIIGAAGTINDQKRMKNLVSKLKLRFQK